MKEPYRVAVWGPGTMGMCAIREVLRLPETKLVSVLAYNKSKHGVDVGTLLGEPSINVRVTTDIKEVIATKPEVILQTTQLLPGFPCDDEIETFLEAGVNVISCLPYQYPHHRGADVVERLDQAGKRGGATLFGTGTIPGFIPERLAPLLTGICNDVQWIAIDEYFSCQHIRNGADILPMYGFGKPMDEVENNDTAGWLCEQFLAPPVRFLADKLGVALDRIERTRHNEPCPEDIVLPGVITAKKGTLGIMSYKFTGYAGGKPKFSVRTRCYLHEKLRPAEAKGDDYWTVQIEGQPSVRLGFEVVGSIEKNLRLLPNNPAPGSYFVTVVLMTQSIPMVVKAAPGLKIIEMPQVHWKPDMRM